MTRINRKGVSKHMAYTLKELTGRLNVGEKTILRWIDKGLLTVPGGKKPILILGDDLIEFLKKKDAKKGKLKRNEFFCFACKEPKPAKRASIKMLSDRKTGDCRDCGGKMSKIFTSRKHPLSGTASPDVNVHIEESEPPPIP